MDMVLILVLKKSEFLTEIEIKRYLSRYHKTSGKFGEFPSDLCLGLAQRLNTREEQEQDGRHQEEDAGHEGGEGQRHGPLRRL